MVISYLIIPGLRIAHAERGIEVENIEVVLQELKAVREGVEEVKAKMKISLDEFQASKQWQDMQLTRLGLETQIEILEDRIKESAISEFRVSQNKNFHQKVKIKIFKVFKVVDPEKVTEWCRKFFVGALKPDMKMVEDYVKGNAAFDGVELTEEPRVQIAKEL